MKGNKERLNLKVIVRACVENSEIMSTFAFELFANTFALALFTSCLCSSCKLRKLVPMLTFVHSLVLKLLCLLLLIILCASCS